MDHRVPSASVEPGFGVGFHGKNSGEEGILVVEIGSSEGFIDAGMDASSVGAPCRGGKRVGDWGLIDHHTPIMNDPESNVTVQSLSLILFDPRVHERRAKPY